MAFVISDRCLVCGSCAEQCPAEAIAMGEIHYEINPEKCLSCGGCKAQCPAEAIDEAENYCEPECGEETVEPEYEEMPEEA